MLLPLPMLTQSAPLVWSGLVGDDAVAQRQGAKVVDAAAAEAG
ncbi:MAG: hypothetical protein R3F53_04710 [Gammaproteobacteria bacterium]